ncbi:hypothetical protein [Halegenticoccus soli]|uniref:hypothetical protein n=1 Tax=Halegenticoccus soli TaxID=1985678 RepID=UPI000C6D94BB|nr:hypothetical protein [Halegenticoccus soli]
MNSYTSQDEPSFDEVAKRLGQHRRRVLEVFTNTEARDAQLDTSLLRKQGEVPTGSIRHHLETLEDWGLLRDTGERSFNPTGGSRARVWALTDRGREFIDTHLDRQDQTDIPGEIDDLTRRVEELEAENKQLKSVLAKLAVHVGILDEDEISDFFL